MNKRIRELAEQAGLDHDSYDRYGLFDEEKFAQMIVQECVEVCRTGVTDSDFELANSAADRILRHFGIEQ